MAFENGEIKPINVQGTANTTGGVTIYSPQKGNRAIINQININFPVAYIVSLYRKSALTGKPMLLYKLSLDAGNIIDDGVGYNLDEGDSLYLVADEGAVNWSVEGWEYEKNCLNIPTSGRGQLRVVDIAGNFKGIGLQGPPGTGASVTSAEFVGMEARVSGNSTQMVSSDAALSLRIDAISVGGASVTSAEFATLESRVSGNSAQMTSADNAISNAVSVLSAIVSGVISNVAVISLAVSALSTSLSAEAASRVSADNALSNAISVLSAVVSNQGSAITNNSADVTSLKNRVSANSVLLSDAISAIAANSAQMTSADNAISNAVSVVSAAQAVTSAAVTSINQAVSVLSQQVSVLSARVAGNSADFTSFKQSINNIGDVSTSSPVSSQALIYDSATGQWLNKTIAGGSGSVTSAEYTSLVDRVSGNSTQMVSADNAISAAVAALSAQHTSLAASVAGLLSAVAGNSAQMTSADNAISAAQATTSAAVTSVNDRVSAISTDVTSVKNLISVISQQVSVLSARVDGNSTQMTSADNAISGQLASVASVVHANSAQMVSADNAISNAVSIVSAAQAVTSAAVTSINQIVSVISQQVSVLSARVASNSADFTSFKQSLNNFGDVSISVPTDGQVLMYNASAGQWFNSAVAAGTGSVTSAELSAVSAAAAAAIASVQSAVSTLQYPAIESVASAVYSVVEADRGKIKYFTNATSIEVILGNGLTSGFQAVIWRASAAGELKISAVTGLESQGTVLSSINTAATIIHKGANVWLAAGAFAGGGAGGGSVTSTELSAVSAAAASNIAVLSATMTSADNAVSANAQSANNALSVRIGGILNTQIRIVSSNQSGNGSALVAISGMVLTVAADETWKIEGYVLMSTSAATAGLRLGWSVPPLSLPRYTKFIAGSAAQSAAIAGGGGQLQVSGQSINLSITGIGPAGAAVPVKFDAFFNVASAGTVNLMACGIASTAASPLTIMAGTHMICYRVK